MAGSDRRGPAVPFPAWWNGVRVEATATPYEDEISLVVAPGQLLEIKWSEWLKMTMRVIVARAARGRR